MSLLESDSTHTNSNGGWQLARRRLSWGRLIVRIIPELIPAIKSYPQRYPEELRTCRKLFQCVKAKKRLAKVSLQIS